MMKNIFEKNLNNVSIKKNKIEWITRYTIKGNLVFIMFCAKEGNKYDAKKYLDILTGTLEYMLHTDAIDRETFKKIMNLRRIILKNFDL